MPGEAVTFALALGAAWILTPPLRRLALRWDFVDRPGPRKIHAAPMPLFGGWAIFAGLLLATVWREGGSLRAAVLGGGALLLVVGTLDDRGRLHPQIKLALAMPAAALLAIAAGVHGACPIESVAGPGSVAEVVCSGGLSLLWIVGVTAAFSILDHMDGLCAGTAAVGAGFLVWLGILNGQPGLALSAAALAGAAIGFLYWNFVRHQIFVGDGGAMLLGFSVAVLALALRPPYPAGAGWVLRILVVGVPIFDTLLVSVSRGRRGCWPFAAPGKDHTAHRLARSGLGSRRAVLLMWLAGVALGSLALLVRLTGDGGAWVVAILLGTAAGVAVVVLERAWPVVAGEHPGGPASVDDQRSQ